MNRFFVRPAVLILLFACSIPIGALSSPPVQDVLLETMQRELKRATTSLAKSRSCAVLPELCGERMRAGSRLWRRTAPRRLHAVHRRQADVIMRVGAAALDNTHGQSRPSGIDSGPASSE